LELYQRYRFTTTGDDHHKDTSTTLLRNRIVYRPIPTSPLTLRFNFQRDRALNDPAFFVMGAGPWSTKDSYDTWLEWLIRWNRTLTTRTRLRGNRELTNDLVMINPATNLPQNNEYTKYILGGDVEARWFPLEDASALYVFQRFGLFRLFGWGPGSAEAWNIVPVVGVIWRLGDKMYLDSQVSYESMACLSNTGCKPVSRFEPRLFFTMNI
jgi:hypothetical protein